MLRHRAAEPAPCPTKLARVQPYGCHNGNMDPKKNSRDPGPGKFLTIEKLKMKSIKNSTRNIIKATLVLALGALSISASAAQWQPVAASETGSLFIDLQSIEARGDQVRARVMRHYVEPRFASNDGYAHVSKVFLVKIDCATGAIESLEANAGNKQFSGGYDPLSLARTTSGMDSIKALACNPAAPSSNLPK
jgi:hypothetical protein